MHLSKANKICRVQFLRGEHTVHLPNKNVCHIQHIHWQKNQLIWLSQHICPGSQWLFLVRRKRVVLCDELRTETSWLSKVHLFVGSQWWPGQCTVPLQHWILSCQGVRRSLTLVLLFPSLFWKVFELNKVTVTLLVEGQWEERSCTLAAGCATGSRQPSRVRARTTQSCCWLQEGECVHHDEYICVQGNVCFCLLWVLLKISTSRENSGIYLLSIFIVVFNLTEWKSMLPC